MTRLKGFKKNRYELPDPVLYYVKFTTGYVETVLATSSRDAEIKTMHLQTNYGFFVGARRYKNF